MSQFIERKIVQIYEQDGHTFALVIDSWWNRYGGGTTTPYPVIIPPYSEAIAVPEWEVFV